MPTQTFEFKKTGECEEENRPNGQKKIIVVVIVIALVVLLVTVIAAVLTCHYLSNVATGQTHGLEETRKVITDCVDIVKAGHKSAGVYRIQPSTSATSFDVFCSPPPKPEWIVIQHRYDGSENFTRPWEHYKQGFGSFNGEFWLGNEKIYLLTNQKPYTLRVELQLWDGSEFWAEYGSFRLEPEDQNYRLRIGNYSGNAGDSMRDHNGKAFTTMDSDNDDFDFGNCAQMNKGAWWYNECQDSNLNGRYKVNCSLPNCNRWFKDLGQKGMKVTTMKIKPNLN